MFLARTLIRSITGLALAAALGTSQAATLYEQPFAETDSGAWASRGSVIQFDSFVLGNGGSITSVSWYGLDFNEVRGLPVNPDSFSITIHADLGGAPGAPLSFSTVGNGAGAVDTGIDLATMTLFRYTGTLGTPFQTTAGATYWLSIADVTTGHHWHWASGGGADGVHQQRLGAVVGSQADDLVFTLNGVAPVPEPASAALFLLGAAGLLGLRPRRRG